MGSYWENLTFWRKAKFIFTIILSVFVLIFAVINWESVLLDFVFIDKEIPLTLIILVCLLVGYLVASLFESKHYNRKVKEVSDLQNEIEALKTDKNQLKVQLETLKKTSTMGSQNPTGTTTEANI